jgi:DNA polymerase III epsilon subunit-like protein
MYNKILYFDVETSGTSFTKDGIIVLACIVVVDGKVLGKKEFRIVPPPLQKARDKFLKLRTEKEQERFLRTLAAENDVGQEIHGIMPGDIVRDESYWNEEEALNKQIVPFLERVVDRFDKKDKLIMAGHNVVFDKEMLIGLFKRVRKNKWSYMFAYFHGAPVYDTYQMAMGLSSAGVKFGASDFKLGTLCKTFGIPIEAHDAMSDIWATYLLHQRLKRYVDASEK